MTNKYYAITEIVEIPIYIEPKQYNSDEISKIMTEALFLPINSNPPESLPQYMTIPMSEETYKFISNVSNIYSTSFGEKEYEINKVKFKIFTEEEYKLRYGKLNENIPEQCEADNNLEVRIKKSNIVELYNFAYEQAVKTGTVKELHELDSKINGN